MRVIATLCALCAACGFDAPATGDDDGTATVTVGFLSETTLQDEASGDVMIPVVLSAAAADVVTVRYAFSGGTAMSGADFTATNGQLTFSPSTTEAMIPLTINADADEEGSETIEITLMSPAGAKLGASTHTVTISSDILPRVGFTTATSSDAESVSPTITLVLDRPSNTGGTVDFALTGTAAIGVDYTLTAGTITIPAGVTSVPIAMPVIDDPNDENDEQAIFTLTGSTSVVVSPMGTHNHTIVDNDAEPTISFVLATSSAQETTSIPSVNGEQIEVRLSVASGKTVTVRFDKNATSTASEGDDYNFNLITQLTKTLEFDPGDVSKSVELVLREDDVDEDDEQVVLDLSNLVNATPGTTMQHAFTITDDDPEPSVSWGNPNSMAANENDQTDVTYTYNLTLNRQSAKTVTVPLTISGSANNPSDYTLLDANPVVFSPGQTSRQFRVRVNADNTNENDETVTMTIGAPTNAVQGGNNQSRTHTIRDDDNGGGGGGGGGGG